MSVGSLNRISEYTKHVNTLRTSLCLMLEIPALTYVRAVINIRNLVRTNQFKKILDQIRHDSFLPPFIMFPLFYI